LAPFHIHHMNRVNSRSQRWKWVNGSWVTGYLLLFSSTAGHYLAYFVLLDIKKLLTHSIRPIIIVGGLILIYDFLQSQDREGCPVPPCHAPMHWLAPTDHALVRLILTTGIKKMKMWENDGGSAALPFARRISRLIPPNFRTTPRLPLLLAPSL